MKIIKKIDKNKLLVIIAFLLSIIPIIFFGLKNSDDINFHVSRIYGIVQGLKNGNFPVFIYPNYINNYGYASPIFYCDFFFYIPALLNLIGIKLFTTYKIFLILINTSILFSMYFVIYKLTNSKKTASISSSLYLLSSYKIIDMFKRAAVGELFGFIFFPFVVYGLYEIIYGNYKNGKYYLIGLIGLALSHNINLLFSVVLSVIFVIANIKRIFKDKNRLKSLLKYGIFSILISLFFTLPMLELMKSDTYIYTKFNKLYDLSKFVVSPLNSIFDFSFSQKTIGGIGVSFVLMFGYIIYNKSKVENSKMAFNKLCLITGLLFFILSTNLFPWRFFSKYFGIIQFPWRLYLLVTVLFIFSISLLIDENDNNIYKVCYLCILCSFIFHFPYMRYVFEVNDNYESFIENAEYLPIDVDIDKFNINDKIISNNDIVINEKNKGTNYYIEIDNNTYDDTYIEIPLIYYKGYKCLDKNNNLLNVEKGTNGKVKIFLEKENDKLTLYYGYTKIRIISLIISIVSLITFILLERNTTRSK